MLYFPVQVGPIAMAYNLSGVTDLKLDATTLAGIFQGKIKTWNDPAIKALNPGVSLPSTPITLAVRSDSSGTTANFSQYLVDAAGSAWTLGTAARPSSGRRRRAPPTAAAAWRRPSSPPPAPSATWTSPTANASGLTAASVKNKAGDFVAPSSAAATAAASQVTPVGRPDLLTRSTQPGADSYPITYQTWDLVYAKQPNANDVALLKAYLGYLLGAARAADPAQLAPLPSSIDTGGRRAAEPDHRLS